MKYPFVILLLLISNSVLAQDSTRNHRNHYSIGYLGEKIFHPGFSVKVNHSIPLPVDRPNFKNRFDVGFSIMSYVHAKNHIGLRLTPSIAIFHSTKKGLEYGLTADMGYMKRFYQGKVFEVGSNGNVEKKRFAGQNALTYGFYIEMGKPITLKRKKAIRLFIQTGLFWESNYNGGTLSHPMISVGFGKYFSKRNESD